ncbi:GGDEF domain-containing protein [Bacillus sp. HMF5848]|uniref:GGDEF domain-containing protein n=1 Tax=Bacillus sp. HMF5848 TaxID=2495421 RepID=UPI000F788AEE|nr:GGDEF domain-containing protein [Bacillus sp. HMF5848]
MPLLHYQKSLALFFIDIDKFKDINDQYGHDIGNQVLIVFADVLQKVFHSNSLVFRLGGDEFRRLSNKSSGKDGYIR